MKKILSLCLSAVFGVTTLCAISCAASASGSNELGAKQTMNSVQGGSITIFGDSIASGYGLDPNTEYNYGQICADYLDCSVSNYAVSGDTTFDLLNVISSLDDSQKNNVADSDVIVISIGGNDMMHYAAKKILAFAATKNLLNDGYTAADIPADPSIGDLLTIVNIYDDGGLIDYANGGLNKVLELNSLIMDISKNLRLNKDGFDGYIPNVIIPNINESINLIKVINPNARIILQTVYQPLQLNPDYIKEEYGSSSTYATVITQIRSNFDDILAKFSDELNAVDGVEIADIYYEFTSLADSVVPTDANPGYAYYFTDIQKSGTERDFHPNQKGHLAIAATILNVIGDLHDDSGLLSEVFYGVEDSSNYPLIALDTFKTVAGNFMLGDVNFDLKVDSRDSTLVLREYANLSGELGSLLSQLQKKASDVNADEHTDSRDSTIILRYYAFTSSGDTMSLEEFLEQQ